ncbi:MAG: hypothetical protein QXE51_03265 [Nitrososphaeria archaeon]
MYSSIRILEEDYNKIIQLSHEQKKPIVQIIHELLNQHEQPTPKITKCIWDYFYWKPKEKTVTGEVTKWEKVEECPALITRPDIMQLPPKEWATTLSALCKICIVKEKSLKQKERKKTKSKISHDGIEPYPIPEEFSPYRHVF